MIRWVLRLLVRLGVRWMVLGAVARYLARRFGRTTVERATEELEAKADQRLPAPLANAVRALPIEAKQVGGSAVVAGRAARGTVNASRRAGRLATGTSRRAVAGLGSARGLVDDVRAETEAGARRLRYRYLSANVGPDAATDALLDIRTETPSSADSQDPHDPHDDVPIPVVPGRRRSRRRLPTAVGRVRRTYRPAPKPWD